jgi:excisionase family DNA binding protein
MTTDFTPAAATTTTSGRLLLTIPQACEALGIKRSHLYRYIQTGELKSILLGRSRRISAWALTEFIEASERKT